jgi:hypothetical protein
MALSYEPLNYNTDVTTTRTLLHEVIPLTGTIVSGTYGVYPNEGNIKNFTHGQFQSVYDYPYLSSSANHIFDITCGYDESSKMSGSTSTQNSKKINMYNQMAQLLLGYHSNGSVEIFESDEDFSNDDNQMIDTYIISLSRLLTKDQIKKGTFSLTLGTGSWSNAMVAPVILTDSDAAVDGSGTKNTVGGQYGVLKTSGNISHGIVFYQAGIIVLSSSAFSGVPDFNSGSVASGSGYSALSVENSLRLTSMSGNCDALRHRIKDITFNNTTEINSTIYFCRLPVNKFNYSTNPTYVSGSKIVLKSVATDMPISYVTTVGLYNAANELLATAKLSEPLRKDPTNELTLRVRLDY